MSDPFGFVGGATPTTPTPTSGFVAFYSAMNPGVSSSAAVPTPAAVPTAAPASATPPSPPVSTLPGSPSSRFEKFGLLTAAEDRTATIANAKTEAGNKNSVFAYRVGPDGTVAETRVITMDAHKNYEPLVMKANENWGFTILPNGGSRKDLPATGTYAIYQDGKPANLFDGRPGAQLVQLDASGKPLPTSYGDLMFSNASKNADGVTRSAPPIMDASTGRTTFGFEDQKLVKGKPGDNDMNDARFTVDLGPKSAAATMSTTPTQTGKSMPAVDPAGGQAALMQAVMPLLTALLGLLQMVGFSRQPSAPVAYNPGSPPGGYQPMPYYPAPVTPAYQPYQFYTPPQQQAAVPTPTQPAPSGFFSFLAFRR